MKALIIIILVTNLALQAQNKPKIIAHRGATSLAPENTISSFEIAIDMEVDFIELDVRKSSDDSLMVIHDASVDRTTNSSGNVNSFTYSQLKSLDAGSYFNSSFTGEQIPSLSEVLILGKGRTKFCIELKDNNIEAQTINMIQNMNLIQDVVLFSFDLSQLQTLKGLNPNVKVCYLANPINQSHIDDLQMIGGEYVGSGGYPGLTNIIYAQNKNIEFWMWTLNDTDDMQYRMSQGVDGIITDYPQSLICLNTLLLNSGLVAYWSFDDGFGNTLIDNTGNNNSGNIYGANWSTGVKNSALSFNGISDYVSIPLSNSLQIHTDAVSISAWVYLNEYPSDMSDPYGPIFDMNNDAYIMYLDKGNEEIRFKVKDVDGDAERPGIHESYLSLNKWYNIIGVYNGHNAMIYLDGELIDYHSNSNMDTLTSPNSPEIGYNNGSYFNGKIDELRIYNRALMPDEVNALSDQIYNGCYDSSIISFNIDSLGFSILSDTSICDSGSISINNQNFFQPAYYFDGITSYININSTAAELHNSSHSFFTWVKTDNEYDNERIIAVNDMYGGNISMFGIVNGYLDVYNGSYYTGNTKVDDNQWHFIGYTWDNLSNNLQIWLDGNIDTSFTNINLKISNTDLISLGQEFDNWNASNHFKGYMKDITIWNESLSYSDIISIMNSSVNPNISTLNNLVAHYFEASSCTDILKDHSISKNDGFSYKPLNIIHNQVGVGALNNQSFLWLENNNIASNSNWVNIDVNSNTNISYHQIGSFSEYFEEMNININNSPYLNLGNDTTICYGSQIIIIAPINFNNYLWNDSSSGQYINVNSNNLGIGIHPIWLEVIDSNHCSNSDTIYLDIQSCTYSDLQTNDALNIYPNPVTNNVFLIKHNHNISKIELIHNNGQVIRSFEENSNIINLDNQLSKGHYILKIIAKDQAYYKRIVIQ